MEEITRVHRKRKQEWPVASIKSPHSSRLQAVSDRCPRRSSSFWSSCSRLWATKTSIRELMKSLPIGLPLSRSLMITNKWFRMKLSVLSYLLRMQVNQITQESWKWVTNKKIRKWIQIRPRWQLQRWFSSIWTSFWRSLRRFKTNT